MDEKPRVIQMSEEIIRNLTREGKGLIPMDSLSFKGELN